MNNELIIKNSWWKTNWKWFLPTFIAALLLLIGLVWSSTSDGSFTDIVQAYADHSIHEKAIEKANENQRVHDVIGKIEPLDKLAILEGNAIYSNDHNSVSLSVRIKGNKGKGKMDIKADKNGNEWVYQKISIRLKDSKEVIQIINDSVTVQNPN